MTGPRIVASLTVKDEVELIERTIAHLRAVGVDLIIACDMYSEDGTAEILEEQSSAEDIWLIQMSQRESHEEWAGRNLELVRKADADWVLFLDADELPIPASGSLKSCESLEGADAVRAPRLNVPLSPSGPAIPDELVPSRYGDLLLLPERPDFWARLATDPEDRAAYKRVKPKVMARVSRIETVTLAGHNVVGTADARLRRARPDDLITAHLPVTTLSRFRHKVDNIRALLAVHDELFTDGAADHWRRWLAAADQGRLDEEFERMTFDATTLTELRERGIVRSAAEIFAQRNAAIDA